MRWIMITRLNQDDFDLPPFQCYVSLVLKLPPLLHPAQDSWMDQNLWVHRSHVDCHLALLKETNVIVTFHTILIHTSMTIIYFARTAWTRSGKTVPSCRCKYPVRYSIGFFSISFVLKEVAMIWKIVLGHLKVKSVDTLLISCNFKVVLGTELVFNCSALRDCCDGELLPSFWNSQQTVQSTLLNNQGNSRFWTISPGLQVKSWNLPDKSDESPRLPDESSTLLKTRLSDNKISTILKCLSYFNIGSEYFLINSNRPL